MTRALSYFFDEALRSLWRRRGATVLALLAGAVSLAVLGGFLLATATARRVVDRWASAAEVSIYLTDSATPEERAAIEQAVTASGLAASHTYVSREQALDRFQRMFPDLAPAARALESNPLPASYEVRLRDEASEPAAVDGLAERLRGLPGVEDVRYDRQWLERLLTLIGGVRTAGLTIAAILALASCLTVTTVVRLTLHARRREIEIMQLVGAPLAYIRGPFVVEGLLLGFGGGLLALVLLWALWAMLADTLQASGAAILAPGDLRFLRWTWAIALLAGGAVIGAAGGAVAAREAR